MTDFRALCAELLLALEGEGYTHWTHSPDEDDLVLRARAALAGAALTDLIHDLELADWPRHLEDKFREDLIRARILLLSLDQNLSRMRVTQGQGCTDQASH